MKKLYLYLNNDYIGDIFIEEIRTEEIFSFSFSNEYLQKDKKPLIDPELFPFSGRQYSNRKIFGFIEDMIPDRFGKLLITKKLNEEREQPFKKVKTSDFLINVNDLSRMGALRIKENINGEFVNNNKDAIPPYINLRELEQASVKLDADENIDNEIINKLLLPGSSLGGARPKANIYFNNDVYIAKFPSKKDSYDIELLEFIALEIAKKCGLDVPEFKLDEYSKFGHTLLVKRFDRNNDERIHYLSGITALGTEDGSNDEFSYLDLAEFIKSQCGNPKKNLEELYKRMIFTYLINNCDNHLRNHAFIYKNGYYELSPMFDVNPVPYLTSFALPLVNDNESKENIIKVAKYFDLNEEIANKIYKEISNIVINELENNKHITKELNSILLIAKQRI